MQSSGRSKDPLLLLFPAKAEKTSETSTAFWGGNIPLKYVAVSVMSQRRRLQFPVQFEITIVGRGTGTVDLLGHGLGKDMGVVRGYRPVFRDGYIHAGVEQVAEICSSVRGPSRESK